MEPQYDSSESGFENNGDESTSVYSNFSEGSSAAESYDTDSLMSYLMNRSQKFKTEYGRECPYSPPVIRQFFRRPGSPFCPTLIIGTKGSPPPVNTLQRIRRNRVKQWVKDRQSMPKPTPIPCQGPNPSEFTKEKPSTPVRAPSEDDLPWNQDFEDWALDIIKPDPHIDEINEWWRNTTEEDLEKEKPNESPDFYRSRLGLLDDLRPNNPLRPISTPFKNTRDSDADSNCSESTDPLKILLLLRQVRTDRQIAADKRLQKILKRIFKEREKKFFPKIYNKRIYLFIKNHRPKMNQSIKQNK
jgi:hypothetical protein